MQIAEQPGVLSGREIRTGVWTCRFAAEDTALYGSQDSRRYARNTCVTSACWWVGEPELFKAFESGQSSDPTMETRRRSEEHTSELQSPCNLVCRLLLEKK